MPTRLLTPLLAMATLVGCDGGAVALVVSVRTDLSPGVEVDSLEVELVDDGETSPRLTVERGDPALMGLRVAQWDALPPSATRRVRVTARLGGAVVASREAILENLRPTSITVLLARACVPSLCGVEESCLDGRCVDPTCLTGVEPTCPGACGECEPQSACDDAACESAVCLHRAQPELCGADEDCRPAQGCVPRLEVPDAGLDAGSLDGGLDAGSDSGAEAGVDAGSDAGIDGGPDGGPDAGPDAGPPGPSCATGGICDYVDQDCGGSQGSCVPRIESTGYPPQCITSTGSGPGCADDADCAVGQLCTVEGCRELCCPATGQTACAGGRTCGAAGDGTFGVCLEPGDSCGVLLQTGCPAGNGCYGTGVTGVYGCFPPGAAGVGQTCSSNNANCQARHACINLRCRRYCERGTQVGCASGEFCAELGNEALGHCVRSGCHPIDQTGCPEAGTGCYPLEDAFTGCAVAGTRTLGQSCTAYNDCVSGTLCGGGICRVLCDRTAPTCTCAELLGVDRWGVCL